MSETSRSGLAASSSRSVYATSELGFRDTGFLHQLEDELGCSKDELFLCQNSRLAHVQRSAGPDKQIEAAFRFGYALTSSRVGALRGPLSKPRTKRTPSASATRWSVSTLVLWRPLSSREIAE